MEYAVVAIMLGLTAGLNPGPLGVFVIHQTLTKGPREGFLASLAPWLTDGPIILATLIVSISLQKIDWFIGFISILGALYLLYLAFKIGSNSHTVGRADKEKEITSMFTAVKINFLNPNPYIFWLTIGGSYISKGTKVEAVIFVGCALLTLSLTKFTVAFLLRVLGSRFDPKVYSYLLRSLAIPLLFFSGQLLLNGIKVFLSYF